MWSQCDANAAYTQPFSSSRPVRWSWGMAVKVMWLSLLGWPVTCLFSVTAPLVMLSPNRWNPKFVFLTIAMTYTEPVFGSYTGVEVMPMFGVRSVQVVMGYGVPSDLLHRIAPVVAFSP